MRGALLLLALGCARPPASFADCATLRDPAAREDCRFTHARALLDQPQALQAALDSVAEPESRDLLLLRLAVAEPTRAAALCHQAATPGAQEKCRQVLGRPHLSTSPQPPR
ncbi:hypothetical protein L6R53_10215 [Myxococcota bacterium]|nr:hypothetical protein [Myxococcota bacterium]